MRSGTCRDTIARLATSGWCVASTFCAEIVGPCRVCTCITNYMKVIRVEHTRNRWPRRLVRRQHHLLRRDRRPVPPVHLSLEFRVQGLALEQARRHDFWISDAHDDKHGIDDQVLHACTCATRAR